MHFKVIQMTNYLCDYITCVNISNRNEVWTIL